ncbi:hypothetical protein M408DRAFT_326605, partial [Serendipita vermifera MAFF 305830]
MSVPRPSSRTAVSDHGSSSRHRASGSVTSNASQARSDAEGRRDTNGSSRSSHPKRPNGVDSAVTRLLVAIKKLLGGLTDWANHEVSDAQISDYYVRFGNDFNAAVVAFDSIGLDMGDLKRIPEDLRDLLERCLAEDASVENLELYLPSVRKIITRLLEGLRQRQDEYKLRTGSSSEPGRARRSSKTELAYAEDGSRSEDPNGQAVRSSGSRSSRNGAPSPGESVRSRKNAEVRRGVSASASDSERTSTSTPRSSGSSGIPIPPIPQSTPTSRTAQLPRSPSDKRSALSRSAASTPVPTDTEDSGRIKSPRAVRQAINGPSTSPPQGGEAAGRVIAPPDMPRYSLQDRPVAPSISVEVTSPISPSSNADTTARPETPEGPSTPAVESSLAALKQSEALQRRASKRFSTYTMSKMAGPSIGASLAGASSSLRRSVVTGAALTAGDLAALTEVDEGAEGSATPTPRPRTDLGRKRSMERRHRAPTLDTPPQPPVPNLPTSDANGPSQAKPMLNGNSSHTKTASDSISSGNDAPSSPNQMMVFFQVGRQVKKVTMEPVTSFGQLRVLFMNKFMYNPGKENFPEIYIRDPSSGVQYELEDVSEVKDKCLLSLNIEPLDQIKQHIDTQIAGISQEIKDLKLTVSSSSRRISLTPIATSPETSSVLASRPTERQFQSIAQRIGKAQARNATMAPLVPQLTGTSDSGGSAVASRIVADLKTQFDEVQNIRRDLGVMRQIYVDFTNSTKESFTALRAQAAAVRQVANTKVGGARASIDSGKARLDKRSQDVLTEIEDLQDTVESLKDDVLKRHVTPKGDVMKRLRTKIDSSTKELQDLKSHLTTIRPAWKKTWEQELQNIVEEQQFLAHQEELIEDLLEDNKALVEVFGHVEKVISIRGKGAIRSTSFRPAPPEEGSGGLTTVMMEIRGAQVDPYKRMKAIEQNQKARQKELAARSDEFEAELSGFVQGKKLKKTGGAEEVERIRQRKDVLAFKAMFGAGAASDGMGMTLPSMDGSISIGGMSGGLPGLAMAPAFDSDSEDLSPVSP